MTTPPQAAARAENGRRHSTGPRTPEGKEASRSNALRHGAYAEVIATIPRGPLAESPDEYLAFSEAMVAYWEPAGEVERELANQIASLIWRTRRLPGFEALLIAADAFGPELGESSTTILWQEVGLSALHDLEGQTSLEALQHAAIGVGWHVGLDMDDDWPQPRPPDKKSWIAFIDGLLAEHSSTRQAAADYLAEFAASARAQQDHEDERARIHSVRLLMESGRLMLVARAEAHLGRELHRTIGLLRTLQADRRQREAEANVPE